MFAFLIDLVLDFGGKVSLHTRLFHQFSDLEKDVLLSKLDLEKDVLLSKSDDDISQFEVRCIDIEKDEPSKKNELARAENRADELYKVSWRERLFAQFWSWSNYQPRKLLERSKDA